MNRPVIGIPIGDPAGIGPEIVLKALKNSKLYDICKPLVVGNKENFPVCACPGLSVYHPRREGYRQGIRQSPLRGLCHGIRPRCLFEKLFRKLIPTCSIPYLLSVNLEAGFAKNYQLNVLYYIISKAHIFIQPH